MATIVPAVKHLSKSAALANILEEQGAPASVLAHSYSVLETAYLDFGASARAAIEIAVGPFAQAADSFRESLLSMKASLYPSTEAFTAMEASLKPSADILAAMEASLKPSAADLETILGRANYFAELTQGTVVLAQVDWRDAPLVPSRPKPRAVVRIERERPLTRGELKAFLEGRDADLLAQIQGLLQGGTQHGGIVAAGALPEKPPMPGNGGNTWADVFSWFYAVPRFWCPTLIRLASLLGYSVDHVNREHTKYKAEYGERPLHYS